MSKHFGDDHDISHLYHSEFSRTLTERLSAEWVSCVERAPENERNTLIFKFGIPEAVHLVWYCLRLEKWHYVHHRDGGLVEFPINQDSHWLEYKYSPEQKPNNPPLSDEFNKALKQWVEEWDNQNEDRHEKD